MKMINNFNTVTTSAILMIQLQKATAWRIYLASMRKPCLICINVTSLKTAVGGSVMFYIHITMSSLFLWHIIRRSSSLIMPTFHTKG